MKKLITLALLLNFNLAQAGELPDPKLQLTKTLDEVYETKELKESTLPEPKLVLTKQLRPRVYIHIPGKNK